MHSIIPNKSTNSIRTMLPSTTRNITCHTDIKRTIALAGEDVDARTPLIHAAIDGPLFMPGAALGPRFRGDDGDYYCIAMSVHRATAGRNVSGVVPSMRVRMPKGHTPIYATRY